MQDFFIITINLKQIFFIQEINTHKKNGQTKFYLITRDRCIFKKWHFLNMHRKCLFLH